MAPNGADQCFFGAHHPFYVLFKKKEKKAPSVRPSVRIRPESRGPQGALGSLIKDSSVQLLEFNLSKYILYQVILIIKDLLYSITYIDILRTSGRTINRFIG